jgi:peroxiredoxin
MSAPHDPNVLPPNLPAPEDDGACDHLWDMPLPPFELAATDGSRVRLDRLPGRVVVYAYPRTGVPGEDPLVPDWDEIPGARGCTPESCGFRDHFRDLRAAGASLVFGLSTQDTAYQREVAERLHLPFALLSDADLEMTKALRLPTFDAAGQTLMKRFTLVVSDARIEHVFYPVFPPDRHAEEVLGWLRQA